MALSRFLYLYTETLLRIVREMELRAGDAALR